MVTRTFYKTRDDGVDLYKSIDVVVGEDGNPVKDEEGKNVPTGLMIRKVGTNEVYESAIDIESAPYEYEETDITIPTPPPMSERALAWLEAKKNGGES